MKASDLFPFSEDAQRSQTTIQLVKMCTFYYLYPTVLSHALRGHVCVLHFIVRSHKYIERGQGTRYSTQYLPRNVHNLYLQTYSTAVYQLLRTISWFSIHFFFTFLFFYEFGKTKKKWLNKGVGDLV